MSRNGTLLPLPDDPRLTALVAAWPIYRDDPGLNYPRSLWLHDYEAALRLHYPRASTADLALTARTHAPFPLAQPGVR